MREYLRNVIWAIIITSFGYLTVSYFFSELNIDIIKKLDSFYSNISLSKLEKYNPLNKYNISLKELDISICRYLIKKTNIVFIDKLSKEAKEKAILHICSQIIYNEIEYLIERDENVQEILEKAKNKDALIRMCLLKYIKEYKEYLLDLEPEPFILCLLENVK